MHIFEANRKAILEHLFKEGVMCVKKDGRAHRHNEMEDIPNLHVMMVPPQPHNVSPLAGSLLQELPKSLYIERPSADAADPNPEHVMPPA